MNDMNVENSVSIKTEENFINSKAKIQEEKDKQMIQKRNSKSMLYKFHKVCEANDWKKDGSISHHLRCGLCMKISKKENDWDNMFQI